jgi:hypothetical protein
MGWRTNAQNLNLNRDYAKLDTKEVRAVIQVMTEYDPLLYMAFMLRTAPITSTTLRLGDMVSKVIHQPSPIG